MDPLDRSEALVDGSLMLQVSDKVDGGAFGGYSVSVRRQPDFEQDPLQSVQAHRLTVSIQVL